MQPACTVNQNLTFCWWSSGHMLILLPLSVTDLYHPQEPGAHADGSALLKEVHPLQHLQEMTPEVCPPHSSTRPLAVTMYLSLLQILCEICKALRLRPFGLHPLSKCPDSTCLPPPLPLQRPIGLKLLQESFLWQPLAQPPSATRPLLSCI